MDEPKVVSVRVRYIRESRYTSRHEWLAEPNHVYIGRRNRFIHGTYHSKWRNPYRTSQYTHTHTHTGADFVRTSCARTPLELFGRIDQLYVRMLVLASTLSWTRPDSFVSGNATTSTSTRGVVARRMHATDGAEKKGKAHFFTCIVYIYICVCVCVYTVKSNELKPTRVM